MNNQEVISQVTLAQNLGDFFSGSNMVDIEKYTLHADKNGTFQVRDWEKEKAELYYMLEGECVRRKILNAVQTANTWSDCRKICGFMQTGRGELPVVYTKLEKQYGDDAVEMAESFTRSHQKMWRDEVNSLMRYFQESEDVAYKTYNFWVALHGAVTREKIIELVLSVTNNKKQTEVKINSTNLSPDFEYFD